MAEKQVKIDETAVKKAMSRKKQVLIFVVCSVLAICICMSSVLGAALSLVTEGIYEKDESLTEEQLKTVTDKAAVTGELKTLFAVPVEDFTKSRVSEKTRINVSQDTITVNDGESDASLIKYILGDALAEVRKLYEPDSDGKFGEENRFPQIVFLPEDCNDAQRTTGITNDIGELENTDNYYYSVSFTDAEKLNDNTDAAYKSFVFEDEAAIRSGVIDALEELGTVNYLNYTPSEFKLSAVSDRLSGIVKSAELERKYKVELEITFKGDDGRFSDFGTAKVVFDYVITESFTHDYAGITFTDDTVNVLPGKEVALAVNAIIDDDSEYLVSFKSSDETVVTVDDMGYVQGVKPCDEPVTITVTLEYLGNTYSDSCSVYVRTPVEKIVISDDEKSLLPGESFSLSFKLKPNDATDKTAFWVSSDENIVSVDENGTVTAIAEGTASIIVVSTDGNFRDSCTVTVTKGGDK